MCDVVDSRVNNPQVGESVYDDLTGEYTKILEVLDRAVVVDSEYLDGFRYNW